MRSTGFDSRARPPLARTLASSALARKGRNRPNALRGCSIGLDRARQGGARPARREEETYLGCVDDEQRRRSKRIRRPATGGPVEQPLRPSSATMSPPPPRAIETESCRSRSNAAHRRPGSPTAQANYDVALVSRPCAAFFSFARRFELGPRSLVASWACSSPVRTACRPAGCWWWTTWCAA